MAEPPFFPGDWIECRTNKYSSLKYGQKLRVEAIRPQGGRCDWIVTVSHPRYGSSYYTASNFRYVGSDKDMARLYPRTVLRSMLSPFQDLPPITLTPDYKEKITMYLIYMMDRKDEGSVYLPSVYVDRAPDKLTAENMVEALLTENPKNVYGIFKLVTLGKKASPPVEFINVG